MPEDDRLSWAAVEIACSNVSFSSITSLSNRFYGVVVSTPDFESGDLGSNPGRTFFFLFCTSGESMAAPPQERRGLKRRDMAAPP